MEGMYMFIEGVRNSRSCKILSKGRNERLIAQIKDGVRDGLRAVKNVYDDNEEQVFRLHTSKT